MMRKHNMRGGDILPVGGGRQLNLPERAKVVDPRIYPMRDLPEHISIEKSEWLVVNATNGTQGDSIDFQIQGGYEGMYDLARSYFLTTCNISDQAGNPYASNTSEVSLETNFAHTMWRDIKTRFSGVEVNDLHPNRYAYTAFYKQMLAKKKPHGNGGTSLNVVALGQAGDKTINALQVNSEKEDSSWASDLEGFVLAQPEDNEHNCKTDPTVHTGTVIENCLNTQALALQKRTYAKANFDVITRPKDGIWENPSFIPGSIDINVTLYNAADNLRLKAQAALTPKLNIVNCQLFLRRLVPSREAFQALDLAFKETQMLTYPVWRSKVDTRSLGTIGTTVDVAGILAGSHPDLVLVAFIPTVAVESGNLHTSSFSTSGLYDNRAGTTANGIVATYQAPVVNSIYINVGGSQYPQQRPYENMAVGNAARAYLEYVNECTTGAFSEDSAVCSYRQFLNNYTFYVFNTRRDGENTEGRASDDAGEGSTIEVHAQVTPGAVANSQVTLLTMVFSHAYVKISYDKAVSTYGF